MGVFVPSDEHSRLVSLGARWLRAQGFPVVAMELTAVGCRERPDVIGFRHSASVVIEVKVGRQDFLADARKPERGALAPGLGVYRFYLCPEGVIAPGDLPGGWGLLHERKGRVAQVVGPTGNVWPAFGRTVGDWGAFQHPACPQRERAALFSIARRLALTGRAALPG